MIFLSGTCFARFGRFNFWTTTCYQDILKTGKLDNSKDIRRKKNCNAKTSQRPKVCHGNLRATSGLALWIQVRFRKCPPQLHRDVEFPNFDKYRKDRFKDVKTTKWAMADEKPGYLYFLGVVGCLAGVYGCKAHVTHYITYMSAAADVLALASVEVDISKIAPGACLSYKWRGKPLFIKNRTAADIQLEAQTPMSALRDPETIEQRALNPEWLIVIGICTHLGCVPVPNSGDWAGGFYCPCHGSHYDNAGRIRKGPAPTNLEVPPYKFLTETLVLVG